MAGKDDVTGEPLMRRSDDTVDKLRSRLKAFHKQTQPVIDYYERVGKNVNINANQDKNVSDRTPSNTRTVFFLVPHLLPRSVAPP